MIRVWPAAGHSKGQRMTGLVDLCFVYLFIARRQVCHRLKHGAFLLPLSSTWAMWCTLDKGRVDACRLQQGGDWGIGGQPGIQGSG